ncbi:MAG TPA: glycosyltransferase family 4 protein [Mariprofundaceae bacterium]|nr:glycosyltransferase family 4 protein [Mariprofundaceae bacterium]
MMEKPILVVSDVSAETVHGGAERMLTQHVRALVKAGIRIAILTRQPNPEATLVQELTDGVMEYRLPWSGDRGWRGLRELKKAARDWWQTHDDLFAGVIAEQPFVMWALMKAGCRLPRLQVNYSFAFEEYTTRHALDWHMRHALAAAAMRRLEAGVYGSASHLLVLSDYSRRRLAEEFGTDSARVTIAFGGAVPARPELLAQREVLRGELGWDKPVVVTLRNLVPRTGVDLLVQAAAILKHDMPELRWCVIGAGALLEPLKAFAEALGIADRIEFTGFLSERETQRRLAAADMFMLPTRSLEGFGLVTVEANMFGLPVVATPVGAIPEVAPALPCNRLAADASPLALARALRATWRDISAMDRDAMRTELRQAAEAKFGWEHHDAILLDCVRRLFGNGAGKA